MNMVQEKRHTFLDSLGDHCFIDGPTQALTSAPTAPKLSLDSKQILSFNVGGVYPMSVPEGNYFHSTNMEQPLYAHSVWVL